MFEQFTCTLSDGRTVTVDINTETYFISDAHDPYKPDWMPNGQERLEIVEMYVSGRAFEEFHCQKDYITDTVTVKFRGDFDKEKAIEYMLRCYPSFDGREVIELSPNDFYMGFENIGYAVFQ